MTGLDADGYGFKEGDRSLERLIADVRVMGPAGVERTAAGWDRHVGGHSMDAFRKAEMDAVHAIETHGRGAAYDNVRKTLFGLTEAGEALVSWKAEHGDVGHKAEGAAQAAALALVAGNLIDKHIRATLIRPMSESLPWLVE